MTPKTPTKAALLRKLEKKVEEQVNLQQEIDDLVMTARSPGLTGPPLCTWQELGDVLGMTRQGVAQAYTPQ